MTEPRRSEGTSHALAWAPQASRRTPVSRSLDEDTLRDAFSPATEVSPVGFVCPPCGRFVRTDLDGVLQALGGIGAVEIAILEGQFGHGTGARVDPRRDVAQHLLADVQAPQFGLRLLLLEDARETALAAAHVQHAPAGKIAEMLLDQLDVIDAGIDGGGEMLLVVRGLLEGVADPPAQTIAPHRIPQTDWRGDPQA